MSARAKFGVYHRGQFHGGLCQPRILFSLLRSFHLPTWFWTSKPTVSFPDAHRAYHDVIMAKVPSRLQDCRLDDPDEGSAFRRRDCICEWYMMRSASKYLHPPVSPLSPSHKHKEGRLDVELCAPPVTTLGVVLFGTSQYINASSSKVHTWILVSVFRRNHWGMGLA